jgi:hypothetical protein
MRFLGAQSTVWRLIGSTGTFAEPSICPESAYTAPCHDPNATNCCGQVAQSKLRGCSPLRSHTRELPVRPDVVWLSHGMWHLPNEGRLKPPPNHSGTLFACETRFAAEEEALTALARLGVPTVTWATPFRLSHHATIENGYLQRELICQRERFRALVARLPSGQPSPTLTDLWERVDAHKLEVLAKSYHMTPHTYALVASELLHAAHLHVPLTAGNARWTGLSGTWMHELIHGCVNGSDPNATKRGAWSWLPNASKRGGLLPHRHAASSHGRSSWWLGIVHGLVFVGALASVSVLVFVVLDVGRCWGDPRSLD